MRNVLIRPPVSSRSHHTLIRIRKYCRVSGSRPKVVAAQVIVVGVLLVVVYMTLLRPEGETTLTSVDAPAAGSGAHAQVGERARRPAGRAERRQAPRGTAAAPFAPTTETAGVTVAAPAPIPDDEASGGDPGSSDYSPAEDQYTDTLAQITT